MHQYESTKPGGDQIREMVATGFVRFHMESPITKLAILVEILLSYYSHTRCLELHYKSPTNREHSLFQIANFPVHFLHPLLANKPDVL